MIILEKQVIFLSTDVLRRKFCSMCGDLHGSVRKALEVKLGSIGRTFLDAGGSALTQSHFVLPLGGRVTAFINPLSRGFLSVSLL